jgi:hypothetical protein
MTRTTSNDLRGVWGSSGSDVSAVGEDGTILHYGGALPMVYLSLVLKNQSP